MLRISVSVVIPTYNGGNILDKCLYTLRKVLPSSAEIIIVDNGSTDKTFIMLPLLRKKGIKTIVNKKNEGFAKASNQGALKAKGKLLLFLNNDCFLAKGSLENMTKLLTKHSDFVATQPVVYDRKKKVENIGYRIDKTIGKAEVIKNKNKWLSISGRGSNHLNGLSATCLLIRRDVFLRIGMFDESFHSYLEDVDLFFRLNSENYLYFPTLNASCTHLHMTTTKKLGSYKERQDFKNWIRIIFKNYSVGYFFTHFFFLLAERIRNLNGLFKKVTGG